MFVFAHARICMRVRAFIMIHRAKAFVCILSMWQMYSNHDSIKEITLDSAEKSNNEAQAMKKQSDRLKKSAGAQKYEGMIVTFINALVVAGVKGFSGMN